MVCLYLLGAATFLSCTYILSDSVTINSGELDLRCIDLERGAILSLEGNWSCMEGGEEPVHLGHENHGGTLPGRKGTVLAAQLRIVNNRTVKSALLLYTHASHVRILINGKEKLTSYRTGAPEFRGRYPQMIRYNASIDDRIDLYITTDYPYEFRMLLGSATAIERRRGIGQALDFFIIASLAMNVFFQMVIFFLWDKNRTSLWFALTTLLFVLMAGLKNEKLLLHLFPRISAENIVMVDYLNVLLALPVVMMFFHYLYPRRVSMMPVRAAVAAAALYGGAVILLPSVVYSPFLPVFHFIALCIGLYMIRASFVEFREGNRSAILGGAGLFSFLLLMMLDIMYSAGVMEIYRLTSTGMLAFNVFIILDLAFRSRRAFERERLMKLNLEREVEKRTESLQLERDRLHDRKVLIDREFELAWNIQRELIPLTSPVPYVSTLYRPMEMIGGDFFDFLRFRDSDRIGIFISDVSGHGVPAALVTSMLKSFVLQSGRRRESPSELMRHLNSHLLGKTGGNFITALYMIYDPSTREMVFCNAGHHYPLLVEKNSVSPMTGPRSVPLALFSNDYLEQENRTYLDYHVSLPEKGSVILYTDGLTEAIPLGSDVCYFEESGFYDLLISLSGRDSAAMVGGIYRRLVEFRGAEFFDDDVCIICLDIQ